jgi:hypothetical protein
MVFTAPQQTLFFENATQMGLINRTRVNLQTEGITDVSDLADWEDDDWDNWSSNSRSPPRIPDLTNAGQQIYQAPYVISVTSLKRLKQASALVRYYISTNSAPSAADM